MVVALLAFLPIFEARVAVPFGLALGAPWLKALAVGLAANGLAIPVAAGLGQVFRYVVCLCRSYIHARARVCVCPSVR